jgi:uncharacterized protein (TIGR03000 family)
MRIILGVSAFALTGFGLLCPGTSVKAAEKQGKYRPARVRVLVPAGTHLTINGKTTEQNRESRHFITPPLQKGKTYSYTFKAEFPRGNKTITLSRKVRLRAGQDRVVSLRVGEPSRRFEYGANRRPRSWGQVSYYRFTPDSSPDPLFGRGRYRDMREDEDSVRD